jgi:hypothetical protein
LSEPVHSMSFSTRNILANVESLHLSSDLTAKGVASKEVM